MKARHDPSVGAISTSVKVTSGLGEGRYGDAESGYAMARLARHGTRQACFEVKSIELSKIRAEFRTFTGQAAIRSSVAKGGCPSKDTT